jgi:hypothetical protein
MAGMDDLEVQESPVPRACQECLVNRETQGYKVKWVLREHQENMEHWESLDQMDLLDLLVRMDLEAVKDYRGFKDQMENLASQDYQVSME